MFDLLLYSSIPCTNATQIIERVKMHEDMNELIKKEIIVTIKEATPECPWDAHD